MENHGETLNAYNQVKEVSLKRLHIAYFKLHGIWKKQNYEDNKKMWLPTVWRVGGGKRGMSRWGIEDA